MSAFGGIVSCNFRITKNLAIEFNKLFLEVIIANRFDTKALKILKKKKNLRLIDASNYSLNEIQKFLSSNEEILVQSEDLIKFKVQLFSDDGKKVFNLEKKGIRNQPEHLGKLVAEEILKSAGEEFKKKI